MNHQTEPQSNKPFYKKWWVWLIVVVVVGGIASSGGDDKKTDAATEQPSQANTPTTTVSKAEAVKGYKIGDAVKFDESEWTVTSAKNLGQSLTHEMMGNKTTDGKFILITYKVTNKTNKEEHILETPKLIDSQGREFKEYDEQLFYLPENSKSIIMAALPSGMPKNFGAIYEVPADAKGLKFQTRDMSAFGADKELVEIGI